MRRSVLGGGAVLLGASGGALLARPASAETQAQWAYCWKCKGLFFEGSNGGKCPASGPHDPSLSYYYYIYHSIGFNQWWQSFWYHCKKCQGLHYYKFNPLGPCPAGATHTIEGSLTYSMYHPDDVPIDLPGLQQGWAHCIKCMGLHWFPEWPRSKCPADGGNHNAAGSYSYAIQYTGTR